MMARENQFNPGIWIKESQSRLLFPSPFSFPSPSKPFYSIIKNISSPTPPPHLLLRLTILLLIKMAEYNTADQMEVWWHDRITLKIVTYLQLQIISYTNLRGNFLPWHLWAASPRESGAMRDRYMNSTLSLIKQHSIWEQFLARSQREYHEKLFRGANTCWRESPAKFIH